MKNFRIKNAMVGEGNPVFIIAEIAQAHDGSLGSAHAYIDAIAKTGVNAIKFQTHIASAESTQDDKFRINCFPQDFTRYDYWKRMEFTSEQWFGLAQHAADKNLIFLSTPFSFEAVKLLERLDMAAWKIASGESSNYQMFEMIAKTGKPVLLSTGMSSWGAIDESVHAIKNLCSDYAVLQCTSAYPCPPEKIGLNVINELSVRYGCPVGLSDHSGTIYPSLAAVALGANIIEVHTVFSKECFGPDVHSSVITTELFELVRGIRLIETAISFPVDKNQQALEMEELRKLFGKSLYANCDLLEGSMLLEQDVSLKKPGTGIPASRFKEFIGKKIKRACRKNQQLNENHFYD